MPAKPPAKPPSQLVEAFRALEDVADIAVLMADDGFDPVLLRVLGAWAKAGNKWDKPKQPIPDDGRPTAEAWEWLNSGCWYDIASISRGANISRDQARERIAILQQARLIYPDGSMSKYARQAIAASVASRLMAAGAGRKKKKDEEKAN